MQCPRPAYPRLRCHRPCQKACLPSLYAMLHLLPALCHVRHPILPKLRLVLHPVLHPVRQALLPQLLPNAVPFRAAQL